MTVNPSSTPSGSPAASSAQIARPPASSGGPVRSASRGARNRTAEIAVLGRRAKVRVSGPPDARIAAIGAHQNGRVSRSQLLAAGLSSGEIRGRVRGDRLFAIHAGVYAVGHPGRVPWGDETAALLASGDGAALCHHSAPAIWDLDWQLGEPGVVHVLVGPQRAIRRVGIRAHRSELRRRRDLRIRHGLPVTSPARTLLDLAAFVGDRDLERLHDEMTIARIVTARECERIVIDLPGHPGTGRLRSLLHDAASGVSESEAERRLHELLRSTDLPAARRNAWVAGYRLDCFWPDAGLAVEVDGYAVHSGRRRFESDRVRDARLKLAGIDVLRVTWRQIDREPLAVVSRIAAAYGQGVLRHAER